MGGASARRELKFGEQRIQTRKFIKFDESVGDPGRGRETMLSRVCFSFRAFISFPSIYVCFI